MSSHRSNPAPSNGPSHVPPPGWPLPFAEPGGERLSRRGWGLLLGLFLALHFSALLVSVFTGNFDPAPNHDHVHVMRQVLERGYPTLAIWPPGFGYYLALKWTVAEALGLPYWTGKLWIDVVPVVLAGVLSVLLGLRLTRNRFLGVCTGLGLAAAPIFALASAEDLAVVLFQPLFVGSLVLLVDALRATGWRRLALAAGFGAVLSLACLVRANPQFLVLVLAPFVLWLDHRAGRQRPVWTAAGFIAAALTAQVLVLLPWSLIQRHAAGESGVFAAPVVYYAYFDGMRRHEGLEVSDALRRERTPQPESIGEVIELNLEWLRRDPVALAKLYAVKLGRTWYLSDSGRWDLWILVLHAPWWVLALLGTWRWTRSTPRDPALVLTLLVILYLWGVSALVSGLARYMAPVYGLLGLLAGVALRAAGNRMRATGRIDPGSSRLAEADIGPGRVLREPPP